AAPTGIRLSPPRATERAAISSWRLISWFYTLNGRGTWESLPPTVSGYKTVLIRMRGCQRVTSGSKGFRGGDRRFSTNEAVAATHAACCHSKPLPLTPG